MESALVEGVVKNHLSAVAICIHKRAELCYFPGVYAHILAGTVGTQLSRVENWITCFLMQKSKYNKFTEMCVFPLRRKKGKKIKFY